jgi:hypothetical protein
LRRSSGSTLRVGTTALKKKGLRPRPAPRFAGGWVGTTALKKKGLRRRVEFYANGRCCWNYCPEEEGIKTSQLTPRVGPELVGTTALKKKGLRPSDNVILTACWVGTTALKKKGLRRWPAPLSAGGRRWNYCPEEEGIKTTSLLYRESGQRRWNYCPEEEGIKTVFGLPPLVC